MSPYTTVCFQKSSNLITFAVWISTFWLQLMWNSTVLNELVLHYAAYLWSVRCGWCDPIWLTLDMFLSFWQIWAGLPAGSLMTNMFAKDLDAGENGTVTFSLVTGEFWTLCSLEMWSSALQTCATYRWVPEYHHIVFLWANLEEEGLGHFEIDSESGDIRTTELFTQNTELYYTLKIHAKDSGAPPLEDAAVIHVQVRSFLYFILGLLYCC